MLFGNFIELLDDLCPGMYAEMLNDRGFEGVRPPANWVYYDGSPTFCDRQWDRGTDWEIETKDPFNGPRCARITAHGGRAAELTQSGLAVITGRVYRFSGWLRSNGGDVNVQAVLQSKLPDGRFAELAAVDLSAPFVILGPFVRPARAEGHVRPRRVRAARRRPRHRLGRQAVADAGGERDGRAERLATGRSGRDSRCASGSHPLGRQRRRSGPLPLEERHR